MGGRQIEWLLNIYYPSLEVRQHMKARDYRMLVILSVHSKHGPAEGFGVGMGNPNTVRTAPLGLGREANAKFVPSPLCSRAMVFGGWLLVV